MQRTKRRSLGTFEGNHPVEPAELGVPHWRPMEPDDLADVHALSERVHRAYPERRAVLAEKACLFPRGCFVLDADGELVGYAFAHPYVRTDIPALDAYLGALPERADALFVHDVALRSDVRGVGHGARIVAILSDVARETGFKWVGLVAVRGTETYWNRAGFTADPDATVLRAARASYGENAIVMRRIEA